MQKIPCQAGIVHLYDINRREFVVTNVRGTAPGDMLLRRHPEGEPLLAAAMRKRRAIVVADASDGPEAAIDRYIAAGGARSIIVAPVMISGRYLGAIELMNPLDGNPFTPADGNAMSYIADQYAQFVADRGVTTDPERVASRRTQRA
jgi:GAF domain-containing protein